MPPVLNKSLRLNPTSLIPQELDSKMSWKRLVFIGGGFYWFGSFDEILSVEVDLFVDFVGDDVVPWSQPGVEFIDALFGLVHFPTVFVLLGLHDVLVVRVVLQ